MLSSDLSGSSSPLALLRHSIFTRRSNQIHSMETKNESDAWNSQLESFQKQVYDRFHELSAAAADDFLSAMWLKKLLDAFLSCEEDFRVILCNDKEWIPKHPLDKHISEFSDKCIKALDICNATRNGIEKIQLWQKNLQIALCALDSRRRMITEGRLRRARKALMDLALVMSEEKESGSVFSHRNWSFGRCKSSKDQNPRRPGHSRSLSWSVSQSWSAAKQLQLIANSLIPPRGNDIMATNGLSVTVFTMNYVHLFVLWALVAAIPCQDRGLQIHFSIPQHYLWGAPLLLLHDRFMDEYKRHDNRNSCGLLKEIHQMENSIHQLTDLVDSLQFPLTEEQKEEVEQRTKELALVFDACKNGLHPLERKVKEMFRKIMSCRTDALEILNRRSSGGINLDSRKI